MALPRLASPSSRGPPAAPRAGGIPLVSNAATARGLPPVARWPVHTADAVPARNARVCRATPPVMPLTPVTLPHREGHGRTHGRAGAAGGGPGAAARAANGRRPDGRVRDAARGGPGRADVARRVHADVGRGRRVRAQAPGPVLLEAGLRCRWEPPAAGPDRRRPAGTRSVPAHPAARLQPAGHRALAGGGRGG